MFTLEELAAAYTGNPEVEAREERDRSNARARVLWRQRREARAAEERERRQAELEAEFEAGRPARAKAAKEARMKVWRANNPGRLSEYVAARRTRLLNATPAWVDRAAIQKIYEEAARTGMEVDHIHPLNGENFCGLHVPWNLQLLTASENAAKGNRLLEEFV